MDTASTHPEPPKGEWWSDEPQMETVQHSEQMIAFFATLRWLWRDRTDYFLGANLSVYFSALQAKVKDFVGPDLFLVFCADGARKRRSWVVWEEGGKYPDLILELLSDSTRRNDRGEKKRVYEQVFRTPEYFLFDPHSYELEGFRLVGGRYEPIVPDAQGRLVSDQLGLLFGVQGSDLRLYQPDGALVLRPDEAAAAAEANASAAQAHATAAEANAAAAQAHATAAEANAAAAEANAAAAEERARRAEAKIAELERQLRGE